MKLNRRQWLKSASLTGGMALISGMGLVPTLSAEEKRKFNPRSFSSPIRLGSNENPYGPSQKVRDAIVHEFDMGCRYPWAYMKELTEMIAAKEGVPTDHIAVTAGSTEGLKIAGATFAANGGEIISCLPTFLSMMTYGELWGASINWVPLNKDLDFDLQEMEKRVSPKTKLVFLCNPNNPTGKLLPANEVMDFCESVSKKTVVFSDEAYCDFIEVPDYPSMVELVKKGKDVIVSKTFSKVYGLAGLRVGYLVAKPEIISKISERLVANTNTAAMAAAKAALKDQEFYDFSLAKNKEAKKMICAMLDELKLEYLDSHANFVFFHSGRDINELGQDMLQRGIIIGREFPPLNDWCRISTGTLEEVALFNQNFRESMA
ncbi:pyridoxal phosphate-dependent aminotransferase [Pararhodonellum marinum]|uniref:pyridoxal phosphate-dependent aminotransferase n=1 Tax=Pararhodonellum marinum TaxID=2755358 RepID=UPI00188E00D6|nr:histidinol-phosphate transaminase [Pararhodonellum marinum]